MEVSRTLNITSGGKPNRSPRMWRVGTHEEQKLSIGIRAPSWLLFTRSAFQIDGYRASTGWKFIIQSYNITPYDAPIWKLIETGNLDGIKDTFSRRLASPNDQTIDGMTLLMVCCYMFQKSRGDKVDGPPSAPHCIHIRMLWNFFYKKEQFFCKSLYPFSPPSKHALKDSMVTGFPITQYSGPMVMMSYQLNESKVFNL